MSTKLKIVGIKVMKFSLVFAGMFGIGYVSADYLVFPAKEHQSVSMSSVLLNAKMGKSLSFVNVQVEPVEIPDGPNEVAEVSGYVTLLKSSNNTIKYQWTLPEGVAIVEGEKEGVLQVVKSEEPVEIKIKVSGYTRAEKKLLTLSASTMIGENSFGNVAILSSRPEDSKDFIAKQRFDTQKMQQIDLSSETPIAEPRLEEKIQR